MARQFQDTDGHRDSQSGPPHESDDPADDPVDAILAEYLKAVEQGNPPTPQQLLVQHPNYSQVLAEFFDNRSRLEAAFAQIGEPPSASFFGSQVTTRYPPADLSAHATAGGLPRSKPGAPLGKFGKYELVEEIARGGMGVVYKARQVDLHRTVAIKMILAGHLASKSDVHRFMTEARAIAQLDHPNIVQVFEVGQSEGQHYFSMAYVDGESLARRLQAGPMSPQLSARIVHQVGLAVAYAHDQGVIHRDLKPANVLLSFDPASGQTGSHRGEAGVPDPVAEQRQIVARVTDFGLAKRTDGKASITATGQILGTPSFMSPEQAAGEANSLRETSDVYSIGALLYATLTGRPPLQADNPLDTLRQVIEQEPVEPRQLNSRIPRDLETICLKCLSKEPRRRYQTAHELCDDLARFLNDEPIQARPAGLYERGARWMRKQRRSVAIAVRAAVFTVLAGSFLLGLWYAYSQWRLGQYALDTDQPPIRVEFFREGRSRRVALRTLPDSGDFQLASGDYLLKVKADGRISQTYRTHVPRGGLWKGQVNLEDQVLWRTREYERSIVPFAVDDRHDLIHLTNQGLNYVDGRTGADVWKLDLTRTNTRLHENVPGLLWPWTASPTQYYASLGFDEQPRFVTAGDLNQDDHPDILMAARHQAWVLALDGRNGEVLWVSAHARDISQPQERDVEDLDTSRPYRLSCVFHPPTVVDDINADGIADCLITVANRHDAPRNKPHRLLKALSGADGTTVWEFTYHDQWMAVTDSRCIPFAFRWCKVQVGWGDSLLTTFQHDGFWHRSLWTHHHRIGNADHLPDAPHCVGIGDERRVVVVAGDRLITLDAKSGRQVEPALQLPDKLARPTSLADVDGDQSAELVLLCQHGEQAFYPRARTQATLLIWSPRESRVLWSKSLEALYRLPTGPLTPLARWPLVVDLNHDGRDEIVVPNGSTEIAQKNAQPVSTWDLESLRENLIACTKSVLPGVGRVQVLDGATGETRWSQRIKSMDPQVDRFVAGPDINQDGYRETYVCSIGPHDLTLFVDCFSGKTGERLWWNSQPLEQLQADAVDRWLGPVHFWNTGSGGPKLVIQASSELVGRHAPNLYVFDSKDGEFAGVGRNVEILALADLDGDAAEELLSIRPWLETSRQNGGRLDVIRGQQPDLWRRLGGGDWQVVGDATGDDTPDLWEYQERYVTCTSSRDGATVWRRELPANRHGVLSLDCDFDRDGAFDLFVPIRSRKPCPPWQVVSGRTGRTLWRAPFDAYPPAVSSAHSIDLDQDGQMEIVVLARFAMGDEPRADHRFWLMAMQGVTGELIWKKTLTQAPGGSFSPAPHDRYDIHLHDLNRDGVVDILVPYEESAVCEVRAFDGRTGNTLWGQKLFRQDGRRALTKFSAAIGDIDGDTLLDIVTAETRKSADSDEWIMRVTMLDGRTGDLRWQYESTVDAIAYTKHSPAEYRTTPHIVRVAGQQASVICLNVWGHPGHVLTLDHRGQEIGRLAIQRWARRQFKLDVRDADGDGNDEVFVLGGEFLHAIRPANYLIGRADLPTPEDTQQSAVLWQRPAVQSFTEGILEIVSTGPSPSTIVLNEDDRVYALDATNGKTVWTCVAPQPRQGRDPIKIDDFLVVPVGTAATMSDANLVQDVDTGSHAQPGPVVLFRYGDVTVCRPVRFEDSRKIVAATSEPVCIPPVDPRDYRPVPVMKWFPMDVMRGEREFGSLAWIILGAPTVCVLLGALLFAGLPPGRLTLKFLLLLPAIVGAVLVLIGIEPPTAKVEYETIDSQTRLLYACLAVPAIVVPLAVLRWTWQKQWRALVSWVLLVTLVAAALTGWGIAEELSNLNEGIRYRWTSWFAVWIQIAYYSGWLIIGVWLPGPIRRSIRSNRRRRKRSNYPIQAQR